MFANTDPAMWEKLGALSQGLASGTNWGTGLAGAAGQLATVTAQQRAKTEADLVKNKTYQLLQSKNPELAQAVQSGILTPNDAYGYFLKSQQPAELPASVQEYEYAKKNNGFTGSIIDYQQSKQAPAAPPAAIQEYEYAKKNENFQGGYTDWLKEKTARDNQPKPGDDFKTELETMKSYRSEDPVKTYQTTEAAYQKMRASTALASAQGDMGIIYGYMKMLDPTSVVREGEYATAENSGGIPDTVRNWYNRAKDGQRLTEDQRMEFVTAAEAQYKVAEDKLKEVNKRYTGLADQYGVPTERFIETPKAYEPLKLGQTINTSVNGKPVTIQKMSD